MDCPAWILSGGTSEAGLRRGAVCLLPLSASRVAPARHERVTLKGRARFNALTRIAFQKALYSMVQSVERSVGARQFEIELPGKLQLMDDRIVRCIHTAAKPPFGIADLLNIVWRFKVLWQAPSAAERWRCSDKPSLKFSVCECDEGVDIRPDSLDTLQQSRPERGRAIIFTIQKNKQTAVARSGLACRKRNVFAEVILVIEE